MQPMEIQKQKLSFFSGKKKFLVQPKEIVRLEAISNYTRVYFTDHQPVVMAKVLRLYDHLLRPHGFIRPNRTHLLNPDYITEIGPKGTIRMQDASVVELPRRKKREFLRTFSPGMKNELTIHP